MSHEQVLKEAFRHQGSHDTLECARWSLHIKGPFSHRWQMCTLLLIPNCLKVACSFLESVDSLRTGKPILNTQTKSVLTWLDTTAIHSNHKHFELFRHHKVCTAVSVLDLHYP